MRKEPLTSPGISGLPLMAHFTNAMRYSEVLVVKHPVSPTGAMKVDKMSARASSIRLIGGHAATEQLLTPSNASGRNGLLCL